MSVQRRANLHESHPPVVLVAIEDEVAQAMVCVALEEIGLHALATSGIAEAADLAARLPDSPAAMVLMGGPSGPESPLATVGAAFGRRGLKAAPTVLLHALQPRANEPPDRVPPPDLAGLLRTAKAIALKAPNDDDDER